MKCPSMSPLQQRLSLLLLLLLLVPGIVQASVGIDEDVPIPDDPEAVQDHLRRRSELIGQEKAQRQDQGFRYTLSATARQADAITSAIRAYEAGHFWRRAGPPGLEEEGERFAGMMFAKARPLIPSTRLWRIVSRMPKGALLHAHPAALLRYEAVFDILLDTDGIVVSASQDVSTELAARNATIAFAHLNNASAVAAAGGFGASIHSPDYVPGTQVPITLAADTFPGGRRAFVEFLLTKVTVTPAEAVRHDLGVDAVWRKFQSCFDPAGSALNYEPVLRRFYRRLFEGAVDDGISWLELRSGGSSAKLVPEGREEPDPDPGFQFRVMLDEMEKFQGTDKGSAFWGVRIIWSDSRSLSPTRILGNMQKAIERKQTFPNLFSGYDLVGQEDLGHPLADLVPELLWFQNQTAALNLTYPFFFHAGETLGDGNATDDNLFDAVLLDSRRIGHGFSLYKHPLLLREVRARQVLVEVSPVSNEVLRLSTDILHHPLPALIAHGVPIAISNDDPAILGQGGPGLSYDFYQTIQGFDNIGLAGLGALAENSLRWSNFEDQSPDDWIRDIGLGAAGTGVKGRRLRQWRDRWEQYCQWVVDEYSQWNSTLDDDDV